MTATGLLVAIAAPRAQAQPVGGKGGGPGGGAGGTGPGVEGGAGSGNFGSGGGGAGAAGGISSGDGGAGGDGGTSGGAGSQLNGDPGSTGSFTGGETNGTNLGGGGGGAGGNGLVLSGTGPFSAAVSVSGGQGGAGGAASFAPGTGSDAFGNYYGGSGGGGGDGTSVPGQTKLTVQTGVSLDGGNGGDGGDAEARNAPGGAYGTTAVGYGGNGGAGGTGIVMLGGSAAAPTTTVVGSGGSAAGGNGGNGGTASAFYGAFLSTYGGNGGQGGDGIHIIGGGTLVTQCAGATCGTITGGTGGGAGSGDTQRGTTGEGGNGVSVAGGPTRAAIVNVGTISGGMGGTDFFFNSNGGAAGGVGVIGNGFTLTNTGSITGGMGGNTGVDDDEEEDTAVPGIGGAAISASGSTINNRGTVTGGDAGSTVAPAFARLSDARADPNDPAGGKGIVGANLTVVNSGTVVGGLSSNGVQQLVAIQFTGGTNSLTLEAGTNIEGDVLANAPTGAPRGNDTFALGGDVTPTRPFNVSTLVPANTPYAGFPAPQYEGFGFFQKTGSSTWTLTGTTTFLTPWQVLGGTLAISSDANLGNAAGGVTLDGGNLQVTASLSSNRAFVIGTAGGGVITGFSAAAGLPLTSLPEPGATLTLTNVIADGPIGGGQLTKFGAGTLVLTADNTYAGGTFIAEGTVQIGTASGLGAGPVSVADGTTLGFLASFTFLNPVRLTGAEDPNIDTGANNDTMSGVISGAGQLTKLGTGMLTLTGLNTYSGGTTIAAGTLVGSATSFGSGGIVDNAALVLDQPTAAAFANPISGPGTVTKTGAGLLDLVGTNTFTGATTLAQGTLLVDGSAASSIVTAQNGTTLGGFGTVGGVVAQAGSTVAPGFAVPYSSLNVAGNVNFQGGSAYQVQINAGGQTDLILATGTAAIDGGTVNVKAIDGAYNPAQRFTILTANAGRTGTFSALTTTSNLAFLQPYLLYDPNDVILAFQVQNPANVPVCQTVNQRAAQSGILGLGAGNQLFDAFIGQTIAGARAACDAASGEIHASAATAAFEDNRFPRESILDRLDDATHDASNAYGAVGAFGTAPGLPAGAQGYAPVRKGYDMPAAAAPRAPYTAWGTGWGDFGRFGGDGNAAALDRSLGGFILGVDARVDGAWFNNWHIGVAGGYSNDSLRVSGRASSGTFEMYYGGLYGGTNYGAVDVKFGALGGGTHLDTNRTIAFPGFFDTARSGADGVMAQGFGEVGYKFGLPRGFIEPFAQGAAIYYGQDGFAETGGVAALRGFARDYNFETTILGLKAESTPFANLPVIARAVLGWRHVFGDLTPGAVLAFEAGGPNFTVFGAPIDQNAVVAQAGLDYRASGALTVGVSYSGQAGDRAYDNAVKGRLEYRF